MVKTIMTPQFVNTPLTLLFDVPTEPVTFSFEEYQAKRNLARSNQDVFGAVKERAVDMKIDGSKVASSLENYFVNGGLKEGKSKSKETKSKQVLPIDFLGAPSQDKPQDRDGGRSDRGSVGSGKRPPRDNSGRSNSGRSSGNFNIFSHDHVCFH